MFRFPFSDLEKSFTENKLLTKQLIQKYNSNSDLYGTQVTFSLADRLGIFLANYPTLIEKIQSLILQDLSQEEIVRKIIINLLNKEFGDFENFEVVKVSIAAIISITSKCLIDYPFEILDFDFNQATLTVRLQFSSLITFLGQKSIILLFCSVSYILEELHINDEFKYMPKEIENLLFHLNNLEPSFLWGKEELIYHFLLRLNFMIDGEETQYGQSKYSYLMYVLRSVYDELDYFKDLCNYFAINRWDTLFNQRKKYTFRIEYNQNAFLQTIKPFSPVFSNLDNTGFRIIAGRARNTGFGTVGINRILGNLINFIAIGDQIKLNYPFKNYQVQFLDSLDGPYVQLYDKSCLRINSIQEYQKYSNSIGKILNLGDILIDHFDIPKSFNKALLGENHLTWTELALSHLTKLTIDQIDFLKSLLGITETNKNYPTFLEFLKDFLKSNNQLISAFITIELFKNFKIPIHPKWSPRWNNLSNKDWRVFRNWIKNSRYWESTLNSQKIHQIEGPIDQTALTVLKEGEITFIIENNKIIIQEFGSILYYIFLDKSHDINEIEPAGSIFSPIKFLNNTKKIYFLNEENFRISSSLNSTNIYYIDSTIENIHGFYPEPTNDEDRSFVQSRIDYFKLDIDLKQINFFKDTNIEVNLNKKDELLDKTILRAKYQLPIFKDGLVHFSLINSPLTTFFPNEINLDLVQLKELGYFFDIRGNPIKTVDQEILLQAGDIIVSEAFIGDIIRVMSFINDELTLIYNVKPFYNLNNDEKPPIGINVIGINKNYSVGIYGRIIGFSSSPVCFASPIWHLSKGSYCDGEMTDSFILDLDCFLNLDLSQIISKIGMFRGIPIFTQIEPDDEISSLVIEKNIKESMFITDYPSFLKEKSYELLSREIITELLNNNLYNKNLSYFKILNISKIFSENNFKMILNQVEKLEYIIIN